MKKPQNRDVTFTRSPNANVILSTLRVSPLLIHNGTLKRTQKKLKHSKGHCKNWRTDQRRDE